MFAAFMVSAIDIAFPVLVSYIIDTVVPSGNIKNLLLLCLAALVGYAVMYLFESILHFYGHYLGSKIEISLREDLFAHYEKLSFSYFDDAKTGSIISRLTTDLFDVSEFAHHGPEDIFTSVVILIGSGYFMFSTSALLAGVICIIVPIMAVCSVADNNAWTNAHVDAKKQNAVVTSEIEDTFSGIRVVKAFTNEKYQEEKFNDSCEAYLKKRSLTYKFMTLFTCNTHFFTNLLNLAVVFLGGYLIYAGKLSMGSFVEFIMFVNIFVKPVRNITGLAEDYQKAKTGLMRYKEIMDTPEAIIDCPEAIEAKDIKGEIEFDGVSFSYKNGEEVLHEFNLKINSGETVAIVGRSGAGKSTVCSLLPRFYEPEKGSISIDQLDIRKYTKSSLRDSIGIVAQDVFLFDGTIKENIGFGKIGSSDDEIRQAAKFANLDEFVNTLPDKYETIVGERGIKLSGGQKQRVAIARIFLKNPPILLLDEATSSLDNENEKIIQESFDLLSENRTTIIIAHRLQTIENAKRIIVLDKGRIAEAGSHEELLKRGGIYAKLYKAQKMTAEE